MNGDNQLIVAAIEGLRFDMNERFKDLKERIEAVDERISDSNSQFKFDLAAHDKRIDEHDAWITRAKTVGMVLGALIGTDGLLHMKSAWMALWKP